MAAGEEAPGSLARPGGVAPSARRRPGYPSIGLRARRARLRFARHQEGSTAKVRGKRAGVKPCQERVVGREEGAVAALRRVREDREVAPGGPGLPVTLVTVRVP